MSIYSTATPLWLRLIASTCRRWWQVMNLLIISRKENGMINKDSKQELDEVVAQAALQQTESQKQAQALAPGAVQQQDKPSFFNVSPFNDYRMEGLRMDPPKELCRLRCGSPWIAHQTC